jgi:PIN domain nuclease of toxin-antitoxin system
MKLLLDTHTFIWWNSEPGKLSDRVLQLFENQTDNEMIVSVVSIWEMQIKIRKGNLTTSVPLEEIVQVSQQQNGIQMLPILIGHILKLNNLPAIHGDPFDRVLVAQALAEEAILVTRDVVLKQYPIQVIW